MIAVFDMGGVLIRDFSVGPYLVEYLGFPKGTKFREMTPTFGEYLSMHSRGLITEERMWELARNDSPMLKDAKAPLMEKFFHPHLDEPTVSVIERLKAKGVRVICATNVIDSHYRFHVREGQYSIFDKVYPSHLIGLQKPDPEFFRYVLREERTAPEEAFFTDDMEVNVESAKGLGMRAYIYTDASKLEKDLGEVGLL